MPAPSTLPNPWTDELPPPPRRIVRRRARSVHPLLALLILGLPLIFWSGLLIEGGWKLSLALLGREAPAEVIRTGYAYSRARSRNEVRVTDLFTCAYRVDGRQYVAITVGPGVHASSFAALVPEMKNPPNRGAGVWVFALP